ncbi:MAG: molybdopterin-dependent oxidoreductase [Candidatus Hodarchaeota archaeon]
MKEQRNFAQIRFGTCSKDCYCSCVFKGTWNDEAYEHKFLYAHPLKNHPFTNGFFCPKYTRRQDLLYHKARLKKPLIRCGSKSENSFEPISLKTALNIIVEKLVNIQERDNFSSVLGAFYSGNAGLLSMNAPLRFFNKLGATVTNRGICNEGGCAGLTELFGTYSITNPFQLMNSSARLIVIWGNNLSETNNHAYYLVKQAIKMGAKLVVVDSRRTLIAEKAHCFLHIFPGTDHLLAKMIISELIVTNAYDKDFLRTHVAYYSSIFKEVVKIDRQELLDQIGIDYQKVYNFVKLLTKFKHKTIFNIGYGIQKYFYGGRIVKSIALIQIMLGNIGKPGTGVIYSQSNFLKPLLQPLLDYITQYKSESNRKEVSIIKLGSTLSSGNYKILFIYNFNPASSLPNQNLLRKALMNNDLFVVVLDMFLNETTKYADIVIPAKFDLESYDLISPYYIPSLSINLAGPCPYKDCLSNYEFFQQIALKIGYKDCLMFQESEETIFNNCLKLLPLKIQEDIKKEGYYLLFNKNSVPFSNLKFPTPNNQIQANGPHFEFGKSEMKRRLKRKRNEFLLISPSHFHFLHSQLGLLNNTFLDEFNKVFLSSEDIKTLDLLIGCEVLVSNEFGSEIYKLAESDIIKPGMALIYSGLSSTLKRNPNANFFTPNQPEELGLSGSYNSTIVKITKIRS